MKSLAKLLCVCFLICSALMLASCAQQPKNIHTGFLPTKVKLHPAPDDSGAMVWAKPGLTWADAKRYPKILVGRVRIWYSPDSYYKGIDPSELIIMTNYFRKAVVRELKQGGYPLVDKTGPGVMMLSAVITNLKPTQPVLNVLGSVLPVGITLNLASTALTGTALNLGEVSIEAKCLDGANGDLLYAYKDEKTGSKLDFKDGVTTWGDVKKAFDEWALKLRQRLDKIYGK